MGQRWVYFGAAVPAVPASLARIWQGSKADRRWDPHMVAAVWGPSEPLFDSELMRADLREDVGWGVSGGSPGLCALRTEVRWGTTSGFAVTLR